MGAIAAVCGHDESEDKAICASRVKLLGIALYLLKQGEIDGNS